MSVLVTQIQTHEKQRHWQQFLVDFVNARKMQFDIAPILEQIGTTDSTEALARNGIDNFIHNIDANYAADTAGGAGEVYTDPKERFPLIEDTPITSPPCTFFALP